MMREGAKAQLFTNYDCNEMLAAMLTAANESEYRDEVCFLLSTTKSRR